MANYQALGAACVWIAIHNGAACWRPAVVPGTCCFCCTGRVAWMFGLFVERIQRYLSSETATRTQCIGYGSAGKGHSPLWRGLVAAFASGPE